MHERLHLRVEELVLLGAAAWIAYDIAANGGITTLYAALSTFGCQVVAEAASLVFKYFWCVCPPRPRHGAAPRPMSSHVGRV